MCISRDNFLVIIMIFSNKKEEKIIKEFLSNKKKQHFIMSFCPKYSNNECEDINQCWHGCDKVSKYIKNFSGGGGS